MISRCFCIVLKLNSPEGQLVHVQQFPLEPLPTEGIFLILRVSRNPTINESRLSPSIVFNRT